MRIVGLIQGTAVLPRFRVKRGFQVVYLPLKSTKDSKSVIPLFRPHLFYHGMRGKSAPEAQRSSRTLRDARRAVPEKGIRHNSLKQGVDQPGLPRDSSVGVKSHAKP